MEENNTNNPMENVILQPGKWETQKNMFFQDRDAGKIKESLIEKANFYYQSATQFYDTVKFEQAVKQLNKALNLNSHFIECHFLRCDVFASMGDLKSCILSLNKLFSLFNEMHKNGTLDKQYEDFESNLSQKLAFYFYLQGQLYYDAKFYLEALDCFTKATELNPNSLPYRIRWSVKLRILSDVFF